MTEELLANMNISLSGFFKLKRDTASHPVKTDSLGADGLWSADMLYRHLQFLEGLVPRTVKLAPRAGLEPIEIVDNTRPPSVFPSSTIISHCATLLLHYCFVILQV